MKRFIKKILIFSFIVSLIYPFFIIGSAKIFGSNQKNLKFIPNRSWTKKTLEEADNYGDVNILFLGSSHAYRGFDIRLFKKFGKSFNLGTTSQTPVQSYFLLKKYLNILKPEYIIIDIYFPLFESDGIESSIDIISNYFSIYNFKLLFLSPNPIVLNTLIYANYYYLSNRNNYKIKEYQNKFDKYISGGFVERKPQFYVSNETFVKRKIKMNPTQKKAFENMINLMKQKNIKYILIHSPITKIEYISYTNTKELNDYIRQKGIFLNFNEIPIPLNDNLHFYDRHHLNQYGVHIFNKYLIEYLVKIFPELNKEKK